MVGIAKVVSVLAVICIFSMFTMAQEHTDSPQELKLSEELTALLQAEMRELLVASRDLVTPIVSGDWEAIQHTSKQIHDSYVMAQNLTDSQRKELEAKLPDHFKRLDIEFHARAEKLGEAAADRDAESVAFHYFRLLETCASCHAEFASSKFPGFTSNAEVDHHH